jgi:hypothetical protein
MGKFNHAGLPGAVDDAPFNNTGPHVETVIKGDSNAESGANNLSNKKDEGRQ